MKFPHHELQPAYVLHARPYRDTSFLLELFTPGYGRVCAVARGARQPRSAWRGLLQPFVPLLVNWTGRTELYTLRHAEAEGCAMALSGNQLISGLYANELLVRLLHREDACPELFIAYQEFLAALTVTGKEEIALRCFEKKLLNELGYAFSLTHEGKTTAPISAQKYYVFEPLQGLIEVPPDDNAFAGSSLLALEAGSFTNVQVLRDSKRLMRLALNVLMGERPLRSRELFVRI